MNDESDLSEKLLEVKVTEINLELREHDLLVLKDEIDLRAQVTSFQSFLLPSFFKLHLDFILANCGMGRIIAEERDGTR